MRTSAALQRMSSSSATYVLYRWQQSTESRIIIPDVAWRLKSTLKKKRNLAITTEGEFYPIFGHSGALGFTGPQPGVSPSCPPEPCTEATHASTTLMARIGVMDEGTWAFQAEGGCASGDDNVLSGAFPGTPIENPPF